MLHVYDVGTKALPTPIHHHPQPISLTITKQTLAPGASLRWADYSIIKSSIITVVSFGRIFWLVRNTMWRRVKKIKKPEKIFLWWWYWSKCTKGSIDSHFLYTPYAATTTPLGHWHCHHYHHYLLLLLLGPFPRADERKAKKKIK